MSVIHAVLQAAASALVAGFSLLIILLVIIAMVGALIATLAGGLGFGGARWAWRKRRPHDSPGPGDHPPSP
ncbi:MAG TPA: hypothetical protein VM865_01995 [Acidobacteriaceae bacterium]|jgi:hypothetical protein|nr:hypothetical protein [Acidobacteriaceae bacterium]